MFVHSPRTSAVLLLFGLAAARALHCVQLKTAGAAQAARLGAAAVELGAASATWEADGVELLLRSTDDAFLQALRETAPPDFEVVEAAPLFDPEDWEAAATEAGFAPFLMRPLWVAPVQSPRLPPTGSSWLPLRLLEGDAFMLTTAGGLHSSTRMILRLLCAHRADLFGPAAGCATVLDYGCGSAVLALAALRLGPSALRAVGTDVSEAALGCASRNAQINGLGARLQLGLPWELPRRLQASLAVANMLPGPLISVAPDLAAAVPAGGTLIVSGFRRSDLAAVRSAFAGCFDFPADPTLESEGWLAIMCTRNDAPVQWRRD